MKEAEVIRKELEQIAVLIKKYNAIFKKYGFQDQAEKTTYQKLVTTFKKAEALILEKETNAKKSIEKEGKRRSRFDEIYNKYIKECDENTLTDTERKNYTEELLAEINKTKENLLKLNLEKEKNSSEENLGAYEHLKEELKDYQERFNTLPKDCSPDKKEEKFKIIEITFYDYPLEKDYTIRAFASGGDRNGGRVIAKTKIVTSNLPDNLFHSWEEIEAKGGMIEWGDVGILNIVKGSKTTKQITIQLEGQAGSYGQDMMNYHAEFYAVLKAVSRPIIVKIPSGKKWKDAIWDYNLQSSESVSKKISKAWGSRLSKFYQKYNK